MRELTACDKTLHQDEPVPFRSDAELKLGATYEPSFTEHCDRIEPGRTQRRQTRSDAGDHQDCRGGDAVAECVQRWRLIQQALDQSGHQYGANQSDAAADRGQSKTSAKHEPDDRAAIRTEGRSDADLAPPQRHLIGQQRIQTGGGQQQRDRREGGEQLAFEPARFEPLAQAAVGGHDSANRQRAIHRANLVPDRRDQRLGGRRRPDREVHPARKRRDVGAEDRRDVQAFAADVPDHSDDGAPSPVFGRCAASSPSLADRVFAGPEPPRQRLADDEDTGGAPGS